MKPPPGMDLGVRGWQAGNPAGIAARMPKLGTVNRELPL